MTKKNITKKISKIIDKNKLQLSSIYRVRQTAVGYKIKNKKITDEIGIVIYVSKKINESKLKSQNVSSIPKEIEGVKTDVQPVRFFPRTVDDNRYRPIEGGIATIRHPSDIPGTLGIVIKKGRKLYALTNNHVGANEDVFGVNPRTAKVNDPWVQPSTGSPKKDRIAQLYRWNRLRVFSPSSTSINYYDFAMGKITGSPIGAKVNEIKEIGKVKGSKDPKVGDIVMKRGRTTRKTLGRVIAVNQEVFVRYQGLYDCRFINQVNIVGHPDVDIPFSAPGDSGSIIVAADPDSSTDTYKAEALLYAGGVNEETGFDYTSASPIKRILNDYNITI